MSNAKELRALHAKELRVSQSEDGSRTISGVVTYNTKSSDLGGFTEIIAPNAFAASLAGDILCLRDHDPKLLMGRTKSGTLQLKDTNGGLNFTCKLPKTTTASDLAESIDRRDLDGVSFGFITNEDNWACDDEGNTVRTILDAELIEISPCSFAAYPANSVSVRSCPDGLRSKIENRAKQHTKKVDGDNLTADDFLYVGDPEKTETWSLPWKFSDEEKTKSHLRDALSRFSEDKTIPADKKKAVHDKLVDLCKQYGIEVSEEQRDYDDPDVEDRCNCQCQACQDGDCANCSDLDCDCDGCTCNEERSLAHLKLQLDIASAF
jgi:hypothetical protein